MSDRDDAVYVPGAGLLHNDDDARIAGILEPCAVCGAPARHACSTGQATMYGRFPVIQIEWRCTEHAPPPKS